jgi:flagellar basal body rod protein FlgG
MLNLSHIALGGLHQADRQMESAAAKIARAPLTASTPPEDSVDLATPMVELIQAQRSAEANLAVIKTADEVSRHTLDVFG